MSFKRIDDDAEVFDYCGICPQCRSPMTFYHDLECKTCDSRRVMWCPRCELHYKLEFPS